MWRDCVSRIGWHPNEYGLIHRFTQPVLADFKQMAAPPAAEAAGFPAEGVRNQVPAAGG